jgi:hypothetical protein
MEFKPYQVGDIVEHLSYPNAFFEIVEKLPSEFDNVQFFNLKLWNSPTFMSMRSRRLWRNNRDEKGLILGDRRKLRHPFNEMEVLAIAWAKATDE